MLEECQLKGVGRLAQDKIDALLKESGIGGNKIEKKTFIAFMFNYFNCLMVTY